jgi:hypothetical protein
MICRSRKEQFVEFADAITAFWKAVPEYCYYADLEDEPKWIEKVLANMERKKKKVIATIKRRDGTSSDQPL